VRKFRFSHMGATGYYKSMKTVESKTTIFVHMVPRTWKARSFVFTFQYTVMVWCLEQILCVYVQLLNILWRCAGVPSRVSLFLDSIVEGSILLKTATLWMTLKSKTITISLHVSLPFFLLSLSLFYFCSVLSPSSHDHFLCDIYRNSPALFIKFCDVMASLGSRHWQHSPGCTWSSMGLLYLNTSITCVEPL